MRSSMVAHMEDVVVLPCVPATPTVTCPLESTDSIRARGQTGMPSSRARTTSGLVSGMAVETTTTSGRSSSTVLASCPTRTSMPARVSCRM